MSVLNPVIGNVDPILKRIFLAPGVTSYHPVTDIYTEIRNIRRTDDSHRWYKIPVTAAGNVPKGGGKFTPRYAIFNYGWRVVPDDVTHVLYVTGEQITDDGQAGPAVMDTSSLSPGVNVTIQYEPPAAEIIQVSTGSGLSTEEHDKLMSISPSGLTTDEHNKLMAVAVESGGRLQSVDGRLPNIPASQGDVTSARDDIILAIPDVSGLAQEVTVASKPSLADIEGSEILAKQSGFTGLAQETTLEGKPSLADIEGSTVLAKQSGFTGLAQESTVAAKPSLSDIEGSEVLAKQVDILRLLGLSQENFRVINQLYDNDGNLTSATVRTYSTATDAQNNTNPMAEYQMTATFSGPARCTSYLMKQVA
jgi:hypothetical protein